MDNLIKKISIGSAQFGQKYGIASKSKPDITEIYKILNYAYSRGIYSIDTAKDYGNSEEIIGNYLVKNPDKKLSICTKTNLKINCLLENYKSSEKSLNLKPEILLAHSSKTYLSDTFQSQIKGLLNYNENLKIGASVYDEKEITKVMCSKTTPNVLQIPISILDTRLLRSGILKKLNESGIEIHARSIFLQGLFFLDNPLLKKKFPDALPYLLKLKEVSKKNNLEISELALLWVANMREIKNVIIGVDNLDQLKYNINSLKKILDSSVVEQVLSIQYDNKKVLNPRYWN